MRKNMQRWMLAGSLGLVASLGGLAGCASADRSSGQVMDDMMISRRVSGALGDSPIYKFNDVDVKTYNGVVQLSGWAMSQEQKGKAADIAKHVSGVREVINNISVKTQAMGGTSGEFQTQQNQQQSTQEQQRFQQEQRELRQEQQQLQQQQQQLQQQRTQQEQQRQEQLRREQITP